jgi:DNA-binding transcriptional MerR regulator
LRSWQDRYGFPRPRRLAGGHRRYDHGDVARIEAIMRLRASGMSLPAAISQAASRDSIASHLAQVRQLLGGQLPGGVDPAMSAAQAKPAIAGDPGLAGPKSDRVRPGR